MFDRASTFGEALDNPAARAILERYMPGIAASPMATQYRDGRLGSLVAFVPALEDADERERLWDALSGVGDGIGRPPYAPAIAPDPAYEDQTVARGSASVVLPAPVPLWDVLEVRLRRPVARQSVRRRGAGCRLHAWRRGAAGRRVLRRRLDDTSSARWPTSRANGPSSRARPRDRSTASRGPSRSCPRARAATARCASTASTSGTPTARGTARSAPRRTRGPTSPPPCRSRPCGPSPTRRSRRCGCASSRSRTSTTRTSPTTSSSPGRSKTGSTSSASMSRTSTGSRSGSRQLAELGIEADLILFHAYDRWGFADLGPAVDERYLRYVVRRLSAYANVWWSMANEYDLLWSKDEADWERLAAIVGEEDAFGHLNSIHNCRPFYDYSKPWITHVSVQRVDVYRTAENTDEWRERWGKPVVIDECAYEGDIDQGWGNITGEEMTRRFWEGAVRGGYVGHGETYLPIEAGGTTVPSTPRRRPRGALVGQGRRALRQLPGAHRVPRHAAGRDARRRLGSAPVRLGRAMGRRGRPAPGGLLRLQPATVPQRGPARGAVVGRGDRHLEPDHRAASREPIPAPCGSTCPGGSSWRSAPSASPELPPSPRLFYAETTDFAPDHPVLHAEVGGLAQSRWSRGRRSSSPAGEQRRVCTDRRRSDRGVAPSHRESTNGCLRRRCPDPHCRGPRARGSRHPLDQTSSLSGRARPRPPRPIRRGHRVAAAIRRGSPASPRRRRRLGAPRRRCGVGEHLCGRPARTSPVSPPRRTPPPERNGDERPGGRQSAGPSPWRRRRAKTTASRSAASCAPPSNGRCSM